MLILMTAEQRLADEINHRTQLEQQLEQLQQQIAALERRYQEQLQSNEEKEAQLEEVEVRIKSIISKKDETIRQLTTELQDCRVRIQHQEILLNKQRTQMFT